MTCAVGDQPRGGFGAAQWFRLRGCSVSAAGPLLIAGPLVIGRMGLWAVARRAFGAGFRESYRDSDIKKV